MKNNRTHQKTKFKKIIDELINTTLILGDKQNSKTTDDVIEISNKIDHKKELLITMFCDKIDANVELKHEVRRLNGSRGKR
jgi:hypothetical protein